MAGSKTNKGRKSGGISAETVAMLKKIEAQRKGETYRCSCCGKVYTAQRGNFYTTNSPLYAGNNGYTTICRNCAEQYYLQLLGFFVTNEEAAVERMCQIFDWYYSPEALNMLDNIGGMRKITAYSTKMNLAQIKRRGETYLDNAKYTTRDKIMGIEDIKPSVSEDKVPTMVAITPPQIDRKLIKFFGGGYTPDEYDYLQEQFEDWTTRYECKTKAQEELFKNICIAQLNLQRAQREGTLKSVADATKTFQDLLGTANIKPSQNNDNSLADQNTFGTLIKIWENERPIAEPKEEWKDVDGIEKYIDTFFLGHLCNLVHVKNDKEAAYREEMAKYTVVPPTYEEDEESETSLLDKFSDKAKDDSGDGESDVNIGEIDDNTQ